jgi:hypothetical protein
VTTALLLAVTALDAAIALVLVRSLIEMRPVLRGALSGARAGRRPSGR